LEKLGFKKINLCGEKGKTAAFIASYYYVIPAKAGIHTILGLDMKADQGHRAHSTTVIGFP
jgi:hypothetical protein